MPPAEPQPPMNNKGGYDDGYQACDCFWGKRPARLVRWLADHIDLRGLRVLDLGCGEGKNAVWLANRGCRVVAIDVSIFALQNARKAWPNASVTWIHGDVMGFQFGKAAYDIVIAYGIVHCLPRVAMESFFARMQNATAPGGYNVVVAYNDRHQDLSAHPGFQPTLLPHEYYIRRYSGWQIEYVSDEDLEETHPNNNIPHTHSMTRLVARAVADANTITSRPQS